jgi:ABC-type Mn2+/Zn2+ transport system ATPase subunit
VSAATPPNAATTNGAGAPLLGGHALACGHRTTVLAAVDLAIGRGEAWFVLGPNGAGKSTLVATLLGLLPPRGGRVLPPAGGHLERIGYVPQDPRHDLPLPITVAEFVGSSVPDRVPRTLARAQTAAALANLGLAPLATRDLRRLSTGQRRRCLVARALARQPVLVVLDEPSANLDPATAQALAADLERLRAQDGTALLHVTHDLPLARRFATHLALVADGRVHGGPAAAMLQRPEVARALGGAPA